MQSRCAAVAASIVLVFIAAPPAGAQYFGRNAVQWERRSFQVLATEHFDIHYYAEEEQAAQQVGRLAERWYARFTRMLGFQLKERQPIVLYASHPQFQQTSTLGGQPGEGTGGATEAFKRRIVLPLGASLAETDHVLGHELVHAFQFAMTGQGRAGSSNGPGALNMPLWFIEGMAEYLSVGPVDAHTAMWIRDAARKEKLPTIHQLGGAKYFPYRYGQALWAYLAATYGDDVVARALKKVTPRNNDAETILKAVTGEDEKTLSKKWHAALRAAANPEIAQRKLPDAYGAPVLSEKGDGGRINVGPALSPDGTRIAFLSERDLFSIELFVADARTGKVIERLSRSLVDTHLESLQFVNSAGAWDRSAERVALGAVAKGRPLLLIVDPRSGKTVREVPFPSLGEIHTPSFSPDGRSVAFSALADGFTDLFTYDLESGALRRLTHDAYADLQPVWSPDGARIAFVTDRFSTDLDRLQAGNYRLATADVAGGAVEALPSFPGAKNINPQWAPSGRELYFLSDARGATNVYRLTMAGGSIHQLTDLVTGVSGITALSPALSAAARADRVAFSVYDDGRYEIYAIEGASALAGWTVVPDGTAATAALIPGGKASGPVVEARADADSGLASAGSFATKPYKAKLGLDFVGQPYVGAGVDRYGAAFAGGIAMSFSDMLGEHSLQTIFQVDRISGFTDVGGVVQYVNRVHRFNWGLQVAQVPYVYGGIEAGITTLNGRQVYVERTTQQRILDRSVSAIGQYPFSPSTRIEGQAGVRRIGYSIRTQTDGFDPRTGQLVLSEDDTASLGDDVNLVEGTAALVHDTSVFGATGPVVGRRLRFDVSPVAGTVNYAGALADLRQYFMPVRPVTVAARVMHYGRYGAGGEDSRLGSLFLGYPSLVRGYDSGSFTSEECSTSTCAVFDQLLGSRLLVGNVEVRAPLLGLFGAKRLYGPLPVDVGAFFDAGVAWDSATAMGDRSLVRSVGGTARLNLFGAAVLQLDYVKPLDRPGKSPYFTFNLLSGF